PAPRRGHAPARGAGRDGRRAPARGAGGARPLEPGDDAALHGRDDPGDAGRAPAGASARMSVPADGYWHLAAGFLAGKDKPNTRGAYERDLRALAGALGIGPQGRPAPAFGIEEDPQAREAAVALAAVPAAWWRDWRDGLEGRPASRRRRVAAVRSFCRWWARAF